MARRLAASGFPLVVWNRTSSREESLAAMGAQRGLSSGAGRPVRCGDHHAVRCGGGARDSVRQR